MPFHLPTSPARVRPNPARRRAPAEAIPSRAPGSRLIAGICQGNAARRKSGSPSKTRHSVSRKSCTLASPWTRARFSITSGKKILSRRAAPTWPGFNRALKSDLAFGKPGVVA